ncbi:alpha/beta hydrolase [Halobacillus sp. A1]|uniref:alpha/beta hydrolase n=1 Tax=Halobacillus sp. A1 TaxID=2880262 RepID=UPI0020A6D742|nr:alpha/beta fold hydrolase [Halobacillus sp. A1]MCP3032554.1 alpha/beta hydrolase [Halobacillus sp. A1]
MKNEQEIILQVQEDKLYATLAIPEHHNGTAVLLVPGSGQVDRHGNSTKLHMNVYKDLADLLNNAGLITLCFDKRGAGKSEGNYLKSGVWDFINDARHWLEYLQNHSLVERIVVIGHSEGAITGPAILKEKDVNGFVFLCGSFDEGKELLDYQNIKIKEEISKATGMKGFIFKLLNINKKIEKQTKKFHEVLYSNTEDVIKYKGTKLNAKWLREFQNYKIKDYTQYVPSHSLAVEGGKDVQVRPGSARDFAANTGAETKIYSDMNHLLRRRLNEHSLLNLKKEYKYSKKNDDMHLEMINNLIRFIKNC